MEKPNDHAEPTKSNAKKMFYIGIIVCKHTLLSYILQDIIHIGYVYHSKSHAQWAMTYAQRIPHLI